LNLVIIAKAEMTVIYLTINLREFNSMQKHAQTGRHLHKHNPTHTHKDIISEMNTSTQWHPESSTKWNNSVTGNYGIL